MKIIAAILSGNAESTIADAIRSVVDWVDAVMIVDTGITDRTLEAAAAAAGDKLIVEHFPWCNDFSAARNYCLAAVQSHGGEWYLMVDSDEQFKFEISNLEFRSLIEGHPDVTVWKPWDDTRTYVRERLIRVPSTARWVGRVHESLVGVPTGASRVLDGVTVAGHPKTVEAFRAKLLRDLAALLIEVQDFPADPRWWYYLGQTWEGLAKHNQAVDAYRRCWELPGWSEQAAWACFRGAVCQAELRDWEAGLATCAIGLAKDARFPELAWLAGWLCYQLGRDSEAITWSSAALAITDSGLCAYRTGFRHTFGWREGPKNVIDWAARNRTVA
jgi:tetratricopeptide (TPR) repeat protein